MRLLTWLSKQRFPYEPLITIEVSRGRLLHNLAEFQRAAGGKQIAPVLKSNAYGHGLLEVAGIIHASPAIGSIPFTVVDSYFEAVALRAQGCRHPLLVIGYTRGRTIAESRLRDVAYTITSMEMLRRFHADPPPAPEGYDADGDGPYHIRSMRRARIHLKIDTGMRRQGILPDELPEALDIIQGNPSLYLEGICTHFSDADNADASFTESQIHLWNKLVKQVRAAYPTLKYAHAANTDGSRFAADIDCNVIRLGIGLYGLSETPAIAGKLDLKPVMSMRTIITGVKKLRRGETAGYGNAFSADHDMAIATIPVGYYEGLDRRLSNNGTLLVGAERARCPVVGRVSMNICILDVSHVKHPVLGTEVTVISDEPSDPNSLAGLARACGTIDYEAAVRIPAHLRREVVE